MCVGGSTPCFPSSPGTIWGIRACLSHSNSQGESTSNNVLCNIPLVKASHMAEARDRAGGHHKLTWPGAWVQERVNWSFLFFFFFFFCFLPHPIYFGSLLFLQEAISMVRVGKQIWQEICNQCGSIWKYFNILYYIQVTPLCPIGQEPCCFVLWLFVDMSNLLF